MNKRSTGRGGLVYSTDSGRTCPDCRQALADCRCKALAAAAKRAAGDGVLRVQLETKGRGGKAVTVVRGLAAAIDDAALDALGKRLRSACGAGGTTRDGVLELQGDHAERVIEWLRGQGHTVKRVG